MKTDKNKLESIATSLLWESRYRKGEHLAGRGAFLPGLDAIDKDFAEAFRLYGRNSGKLLEIGAGLGMQAIRYAQYGFAVTATDVSGTAVEIARGNAAKAEIPAASLNVVTDNILSSTLQEKFDLVADRGCFTLFKAWEHEDYCRNVRRLLNDNGLFLLKVDAGSRATVKSLETHFCIERSWGTFYHGGQQQGPPANFFILKPLLSLETLGHCYGKRPQKDAERGSLSFKPKTRQR